MTEISALTDFELPATGNQRFRLSAFRGHPLVLYFYPKDDTPFELLSDAHEGACALFGVIKLKNMYGRPVRGTERSTFVIDREGRIAREWRGVKVPGHARAVLEYVQGIRP
ncbi:MAG TPA: redoxin domain-containing protein [Usitatibacter sp.]|jgi:peroxiredoxin Q/BCP|nr:redoxin domain-containing protein [Usitatibacter sp.]